MPQRVANGESAIDISADLRSLNHFAPPDGRGMSDVTAGTSSKGSGELLTNVLASRAQPTEKIDLELVNHFLRIFFLVTLFRLRAFLLHFSQRLCHVFDLIPEIAAYIDWRGLLSRHRDTVAGPCIYLDDFLLL